jgi:hypothetical protein
MLATIIYEQQDAKMTKIASIVIITLISITSCQDIETGDSLDNKTISKIKEIGLLGDDEKIIKYYSNFQKDKAGNFFTDKRIAHYWLDEHNDSKTDISFAYYQDIISIDTNFKVHDFDIPYMTVRKRDSTIFKVYISGTYRQEKAFCEEAMKLWKKNVRIKRNDY